MPLVCSVASYLECVAFPFWGEIMIVQGDKHYDRVGAPRSPPTKTVSALFVLVVLVASAVY